MKSGYIFDRVKLIKVVDADTIEFEVDLGFRTKMQDRFRLVGIDAPETYRPMNEAEKAHGEAATRYVKGILESAEGQITISSRKSGIYGRWEAEVFVGGRSLAEMMKEAGFEKKSNGQYQKEQLELNGVAVDQEEE